MSSILYSSNWENKLYLLIPQNRLQLFDLIIRRQNDQLGAVFLIGIAVCVVHGNTELIRCNHFPKIFLLTGHLNSHFAHASEERVVTRTQVPQHALLAPNSTMNTTESTKVDVLRIGNSSRDIPLRLCMFTTWWTKIATKLNDHKDPIMIVA